MEAYFMRNGFSAAERDNSGGIFFRRDNVFVKISYYSEECPAYVLNLTIGMGGQEYDKGLLSAVPLWYILPRDNEKCDYSSWIFSSEQQLERQLTRVVNEILMPYIDPLWRNKELLDLLIGRFRRENRREQ